jgi:hypothetical protein
MNTLVLYPLVLGNAIRKAIIAGIFGKIGYKNSTWINLSMLKTVYKKTEKMAD